MTLPKSGKARVPEGFEGAFVAFQRIPNVGRATAEDLVRLRVRSVKALAKKKPMALYRAICELDGARHDPCVIDVFMAAVEFANTGKCKPWWEYTAERKVMVGEEGKKKSVGGGRRGSKGQGRTKKRAARGAVAREPKR